MPTGLVQPYFEHFNQNIMNNLQSTALWDCYVLLEILKSWYSWNLLLQIKQIIVNTI